MTQTLYNGASAMSAQVRNIAAIANNVSNISTTGFKKSRTDFKDALYQRMISPADNSPARNLMRGTGVSVLQTMRVFEQGAMLPTGEKVDFAIEGQGFFTLEAPNGDTVYSRNGSMSLSVEEDGTYLANADGYYYLDDSGRRIQVQGGEDSLSVDGAGLISGGGRRARLGIATFRNPSGLEAAGNSVYRVSANSGDAEASDDYKIRQGNLEGSNVDLGEEMSRLVRAQRAYQLASRCVSTADQMAQLANSLRQ